MKIVLPFTIVLFCALIGYNASIASKNLRAIKDNAAQRLDASDVQAAITAVDLDLHAIETGQRGYLLTGDDSYLAPFTQAVANLPVHLSDLRSHLAGRPNEERAIEKQLESVAEAKIDDANETIRLRQKGYRHRAFVLVDSNRGKELMDQSRSLLASLASTERAKFAGYEKDLNSSIHTGSRQTLLASLVLLVFTVLALAAFDWRSKRLERARNSQAETLRATSERLDALTSTIETELRSTLLEIQNQADCLVRVDGGFLPRSGQERLEWIHGASSHLNGVLDELLASPTAADRASEPRKVEPQAADSELARSRTA